MRRPGYREAIEWIAYNDDTYWLDDPEPIICVTAGMVRDLYGVDDKRVIEDLRRARAGYAKMVAWPRPKPLRGRDP